MEAIKILLLTEDTSKQARSVQEKLVKLLLRSVDPEANLRAVEFDVPGTEKLRSAAKLTNWNTKKRRGPIDEDFRQLLKGIATRLKQGRAFVTFHFDGDRRWSEEESSDNVSAFAANVIEPLRTLLKSRVEQKIGNASSTDEERLIDQELRRLLPITPFYSIEAWLYQNVEVLDQHCRCEPSRRKECEAMRAQWKLDRSLLDEIEQPKEALCVGDTCNEQLALSMTNGLFQKILEIDKSLAATRKNWLSRQELIDLLGTLRDAS